MFSLIGLFTTESGSSFSLLANDKDLSFVTLLNGGFKVTAPDFSSLYFKHYSNNSWLSKLKISLI